MKGRETFYRRHTVPVTNCSEVKYVLKRVSFGSKDCTKELKLESMGIFPNAQGQLTHKPFVEYCPISNPSEILWVSLLPARIKKKLEWSKGFPHYNPMGAICCHGNQRSNLISFCGRKASQQRMKNNSIQLLYCLKTIEKNFLFFNKQTVFFLHNLKLSKNPCRGNQSLE